MYSIVLYAGRQSSHSDQSKAAHYCAFCMGYVMCVGLLCAIQCLPASRTYLRRPRFDSHTANSNMSVIICLECNYGPLRAELECHGRPESFSGGMQPPCLTPSAVTLSARSEVAPSVRTPEKLGRSSSMCNRVGSGHEFTGG